MGLRIQIESLGSPQRNFHEVKRELIAAGKKFDAESLRSIPYDELPLCALAPAGEAMCSLKLVQDEKVQRRERFLIMPDEEFFPMKNFLTIERMWDDVLQERAYRILPHWDDMNDRQRLWLKLNCVYNHIDNPYPRGGEALVLIKFCAGSGSLPPEVCMTMNTRIRDLLRLYPVRIADTTFRDRISSIADAVFQFLPEDERKAIENEEIQGYSCTSDCYRVLLP